MEKPNFKKMCLMYIQQLTNFPYIEKDFDALTDYQFLCKVVAYLNKIITNENQQNETITALYNAFVELKDYVDNYFDNLDVQEEINNKLDEMVESGELQEIIASYLNSKAIFAFDNLESMKNATNLIDGSYAETLGYYNINDGGSAKYKVRQITNEDIVDEMFIIALNDINLIAELIIENNIYNVKQLGLKTDGSDNSSLLSSIITKVSQGCTLYFPSGKYTFNTPITVTKRINLTGEEISITDIDNNFGTSFMFNNLTSGQSAVTLPATKCLIKNILFYSNSYELSDTRSNIGKGVDVFTETINVNNVNGISFSGIAYGTTIKNCRFVGFSNRAINGNTFHIIENCSFWRCNEGIHVNSDNTVNNNRFFHVTRGIVTGGSNNIITNNRMDSVKEYGVYLNTGKGNIVNNLNVDYCQYNAVYVFNNQNTLIDNIEARCGTIYPYDSANDGNLNQFVPNSDYLKYTGVVQMAGFATRHNVIKVSSQIKNPLDTDSNYKVSLFAITTINHPTENEYYCGYDEYYFSSEFYTSYIERAIQIADGNFTGVIHYKGKDIAVYSDINSFSNSSNWSKIFVSEYSNPTK